MIKTQLLLLICIHPPWLVLPTFAPRIVWDAMLQKLFICSLLSAEELTLASTVLLRGMATYSGIDLSLRRQCFAGKCKLRFGLGPSFAPRDHLASVWGVRRMRYDARVSTLISINDLVNSSNLTSYRKRAH